MDLCFRVGMRSGCLRKQRNSSCLWVSTKCFQTSGMTPCWQSRKVISRWSVTQQPGTWETGRTLGEAHTSTHKSRVLSWSPGEIMYMGFLCCDGKTFLISWKVHGSHKYRYIGATILINQPFFPADKDNRSQILICKFRSSLRFKSAQMLNTSA